MVKASELRIGNTLYDTEAGLYVEVTDLHEDRFSCRYPDGTHANTEDGNEFDGTILSPEVLKACGFVHHARAFDFGMSGFYPDSWYYILDGYDTSRQPKYKFGFMLSRFRDGWYYQNGTRTKGIKIEYLHQLQNLYYSLTGEDLQVNLKEKV